MKPALENSVFFVKMADDANCLMVSTALQNAIRNSAVDVYLIGQNIDFLILKQYVNLVSGAQFFRKIHVNKGLCILRNKTRVTFWRLVKASGPQKNKTIRLIMSF